jgi:hypothetical protein
MTRTQINVQSGRGESEHIDLLCHVPQAAFTEPQHIFSHLLRLAQPLMTDYRSDLWHDAMFLQEHFAHVAPDMTKTFHWYISPTHTWIGMQPIRDPYSHTKHYLFTLAINDRHWWVLTIDLVQE